ANLLFLCGPLTALCFLFSAFQCSPTMMPKVCQSKGICHIGINSPLFSALLIISAIMAWFRAFYGKVRPCDLFLTIRIGNSAFFIANNNAGM
ncbi:MAG: hypothetical protein RBT43_06710, partial [bacterium]|nr:hypothetical protein [bacterium]